MIRRPPSSTRTYTLFPYTTLFRSEGAAIGAQITHGGAFTFVPELSTRYPRSASGGFNAAGVLSGRLFRTAMTEAEMGRSEERRVGKGCVSACRSRWSPYH